MVENMKHLSFPNIDRFWSKSISEKEFYPDDIGISSYYHVLDIIIDFT